MCAYQRFNQKIPTIQTNGTDDIHHRASGDKL